jgi:hypothetical protein
MDNREFPVISFRICLYFNVIFSSYWTSIDPNCPICCSRLSSLIPDRAGSHYIPCQLSILPCWSANRAGVSCFICLLSQHSSSPQSVLSHWPRCSFIFIFIPGCNWPIPWPHTNVKQVFPGLPHLIPDDKCSMVFWKIGNSPSSTWCEHPKAGSTWVINCHEVMLDLLFNIVVLITFQESWLGEHAVHNWSAGGNGI